MVNPVIINRPKKVKDLSLRNIKITATVDTLLEVGNGSNGMKVLQTSFM